MALVNFCARLYPRQILIRIEQVDDVCIDYIRTEVARTTKL